MIPTPNTRATRPDSTLLPRRAALALALCAIAVATVPLTPRAQAQGEPPPQAYSIAAVANPIDFRLLAARATISKRDYVLSDEHPPLLFPLGENHYRLDLHLKRNSRKSWRSDEKLSVHFYYDGSVLTFFYDRNENGRLDRREDRQEHLIDYKQEIIHKGGRSIVRGRDLHIELGRKLIRPSYSVRNLQLHFIFPQ